MGPNLTTPNRRPSRGERLLRFDQEDRDQSVGAGLVLRVRRIRLDRAFPPDLSFSTVELPGTTVDDRLAVLDGDRIGIRLEVVVPDRMLRCTALGGDHGVLAVVLHPHQRELTDLAGLVAPSGEDHHRPLRFAQQVAFPAAGPLVQLDLITYPLLGTR